MARPDAAAGLSTAVGEPPGGWFRLAAAIVLLLTALRMLLLANEAYPLYGDEAQYWVWAQDLDWGYYSKPPLIAWIIKLGTLIAGDREFGVRFFSPLLHFGTALVLFGIGKRLYGPRVGFWSAIVYASLPAVAFSSLFMSTDVPLLFCWALALLAYLRVQDRDAGKPAAGWWILLGLAIGFGLLAKYAMAFFLVAMGLHVVLRRRALLAEPRFWMALMLGLAVFAPNIWWNAQNSFATVAHTGDNANLGGTLFRPIKFLEFIGSQFGVFGPVLFATLLALAVGMRRLVTDPRDRLLLLFALPPLLVIAGVAFLSRANANWAATAYVAATPLVVAWLLRRNWGGRAVMASVALHLALAGVGYAYQDLGLNRFLKRDPAVKLEEGRRLAAALKPILLEEPGLVLMTENRMLFASLAFYLRTLEPPVVQVQWNPDGKVDNHFEMKTRVEDHARDRILFVTLSPNPPALERFELKRLRGTTTLLIRTPYERRYQLFDIEGLKPAPTP